MHTPPKETVKAWLALGLGVLFKKPDDRPDKWYPLAKHTFEFICSPPDIFYSFIYRTTHPQTEPKPCAPPS